MNIVQPARPARAVVQIASMKGEIIIVPMFACNITTDTYGWL